MGLAGAVEKFGVQFQAKWLDTSLTAKGDRGISSKESSYIFFAGKTFLPIGTREYQQLFSIS